MSNMNWVKREIEIANKKIAERYALNDEARIKCLADNEKALSILKILGDDEYAYMPLDIVNKLFYGKPLTPIEDVPEAWSTITSEIDGVVTYQCNRMSSLFKDVSPDGSVKYSDVDRYKCFDITDPTTPYSIGLASAILNDLYPIRMPYMPADKKIKVFCTDLLTDPKNGDFDTMAVFYAILPDGTKVNINRFFREPYENEEPKYQGWTEINLEEFVERLGLEYARTGVTKEAIVRQINRIAADNQMIFLRKDFHIGDGRAIFTKGVDSTNVTIGDGKIVSTAVDSHGNSSTITQSVNNPTIELNAGTLIIDESDIIKAVMNNIERAKGRGIL